jgi:hypothetical protein
MTAKDMFEALGWELGILKEDDRDDILYYRKKQGSATYDLDFYLQDKTYWSYGYVHGREINCPLGVDEHLAITQQMKELGWLDEPETLDHLFGDVAYDLSKLTLFDYGDTYTLEEAEKILDIDDAVAYQLYGTEAQHIKNHMAKVAERDLRKREIALEYEKTYNEVTGRSCARYELAEED